MGPLPWEHRLPRAAVAGPTPPSAERSRGAGQHQTRPRGAGAGRTAGGLHTAVCTAVPGGWDLAQPPGELLAVGPPQEDVTGT